MHRKTTVRSDPPLFYWNECGRREGRRESRDRAESGLHFKYFRYDGGEDRSKAEAEWGTCKRPGEIGDDSLS